MNNTLLIFVGAGMGGILRYWVSNGIHFLLGRTFPYGTLAVNVSGCFLMGLLFIFLFERIDGIAPQLRSFLLIGLLGGYTTFSSFSVETLNLFENGAWLTAALNVLLSITLCLVFAWLGIYCHKSI